MTPQLIIFGMIAVPYLAAVYVTVGTTPVSENGFKVKISRINKGATVIATALGITFDLNLLYLCMCALKVI